MGWLAISIVFAGLAVSHGLTQIARSLYRFDVYHHIGSITIEEEKARLSQHDNRTRIRQSI